MWLELEPNVLECDLNAVGTRIGVAGHGSDLLGHNYPQVGCGMRQGVL